MFSRRVESVDDGWKRLVVRAAVSGVSSLALAVSLVVGSAPQRAAADPPLTVTEAKTQIMQLQTEAEALDQQYVGVAEKLKAGQQQLKRKRTDVKAQTAKVARMRLQVGQVALAQFQNRNLDTAAQLLFNTDTEGFLSQVSTVEKVSENQNATLQEYQAEQAQLAELERSAETDVALLKEHKKELKKLRAASDAKLAASQAVLNRLSAAERQRIAAEEDRASRQAKKQAEAAAQAKAPNNATNGTRGQQTSRGTQRTNDTQQTGTQQSTTDTAVSGSGRGATALAFAKAQLGKPYRFAAAGPDSYDCSGLTLAAWRAAGVSLPRTSQAQYGVGRSVSRSELQPGDLVFFYGDVSHVALYAGNGMLLHSPRPGRSVEYMKMSYMPYVGARRPG